MAAVEKAEKSNKRVVESDEDDEMISPDEKSQKAKSEAKSEEKSEE